MTASLIEKLEMLKHYDHTDQEQLAVNEGVDKAVAIVRQHEAEQPESLDQWLQVLKDAVKYRGLTATQPKQASGVVQVCPDCDIAGCKHIREAEQNTFPASETYEKVREALRFYGGDDALAHVDDDVKQEYISGKGWADFGDFAREALRSLPALKPQHALLPSPTEEMCKRARGFIMGLDLVHPRNWANMHRHLEAGGYPTLPQIKEQASLAPTGHITKWDVAECIYLLMTTTPEGEQP